MLRWITDARHGAGILATLVLVGYAASGFVVYRQLGVTHFLELARLCGVAAACIYVSSRVPLADWLLRTRHPRLVLPERAFVGAVWALFAGFVLTAWLTAERIPLVAALAGADPDTLKVLREQFLKARTGVQASFVYVNALFAGALVPYCLARMFWRRWPTRWLAFGFFLVYCISFLEKAFFFKAAFPLLYLLLQQQVRGRVRIPSTAVIGGLGALLLIVTVLAGTPDGAASGGSFFSTEFAGQGALGLLLWRSVAIPLVTAADALRVFADDFGGRPLLGATSTALAALLGQPRVEFERLVFFAQWGQNETGTGSANSVFVTEAFINFGLAGVAVFSAAVGGVLRLFAVSRDEALRAVWPLFALAVYTSGLIGVFLSNGFLLLIVFALGVRLGPSPTRRDRAVPPGPPASPAAA